MIRHYLQSTLKIILKNKIPMSISILGLSISFCLSLLIFSHIWQENQMNHYGKASKNLYFMEFKNSYFDYATLRLITNGFTEIESISGVNSFSRGLNNIEYRQMESNSKTISVDSNYLSYVPLPLVKGSSKNPLNHKRSILITSTLANKLKFIPDSIGSQITLTNLANGKRSNYTVDGIINDTLNKSIVKAEIYLPHNYSRMDPYQMGYMNLVKTTTYLNAKEITALEDKITDNFIDFATKKGIKADFLSQGDIKLIPFENYYFEGKLGGFRKAKKNSLDTYLIVGILLLVIGSINFITTNSYITRKRSKEIGLRKTLGAKPFDLFKQAIIDSIIISLLALIIAIIILLFFTPILKQWLIGINISYFKQIPTAILLISPFVAALNGLIAAIYPGVILTQVKPIDVLNRATVINSKSLGRRKLVNIFQYAITCMMIYLAYITAYQTYHLSVRPLGYDVRNAVCFLDYHEMKKTIRKLEVDLLQSPHIEKVSFGQEIPGTFRNILRTKIDSKEINIRYAAVANNFLDFFEIPLLEGRNLEQEDYNTKKKYAIVNQQVANFFQEESPIGQKVGGYQVVGIMKDFINKRKSANLEPCMITTNRKSEHLNRVVVKFKEGHFKNGMDYLKVIFHKYGVDAGIKIRQLEKPQDFAALKKSKELKTLIVFTIIALLLSCSGLFSMASFYGEAKKKEISIRKINGASSGQIFFAVLKNYLWLILISNIIAIPTAIYLSDRWLNQYSYRVDHEWWVAGAVLVSSGIIALLMVSYQSIKVSVLNPLEFLRRS